MSGRGQRLKLFFINKFVRDSALKLTQIFMQIERVCFEVL